jgi:tetraacyldisaccharide 4'-kinase
MKRYFYELMTDARQQKMDKAVQWCLLMLSKVYGFIAEITHAMYQEHWFPVYRSPKPVISVGNITVGGVGKTPLVIWLVKVLTEKNYRVVVLSRGYGGINGRLNDETRMFKEIFPKIPIMIGRNRKESIRKALNQEPVDIFIADDAFQHWPLDRDLDIVLIDASNPFGNGYLVPRGILREKIDALIRTDIFILTKTDQIASTKPLHAQLRQINSRALIVEAQHVPRCFRDIFSGKIYDLDFVKNQKVAAFCAIGDPFSFAHTLQQVGPTLTSNFTFTDHHIYTDEDIMYVIESARKENVNILVTTHKDAVKISDFRTLFQGLTVLSLEIDFKFNKGEDEVIQRILSLRRN